VTEQQPRRFLTVVVCAAGPAGEAYRIVELAQERGWAVDAVATPDAVPFLDMPKLEALTGRTVRSEHRKPTQDRGRSPSDADAFVVAPATFNTVCKLALGIGDTYALSILGEAIGRGVPVAVLPFVNSALAGRKPFVEAVESLRAEGVRVLFGPGEWVPHRPATGGGRVASFPWGTALDAAGVRAPS
jgi:phosphopantothenoylcysteine synthetase/decarboxylase